MMETSFIAMDAVDPVLLIQVGYAIRLLNQVFVCLHVEIQFLMLVNNVTMETSSREMGVTQLVELKLRGRVILLSILLSVQRSVVMAFLMAVSNVMMAIA